MIKTFRKVMGITLAIILCFGMFSIASTAFSLHLSFTSADGTGELRVPVQSLSLTDLNVHHSLLRGEPGHLIDFHWIINAQVVFRLHNNDISSTHFYTFLSHGGEAVERQNVDPGIVMSEFFAFWLQRDTTNSTGFSILHCEQSDTVQLTTIENRTLLFCLQTGELLQGETFSHACRFELAVLYNQTRKIEQGDFTKESFRELQQVLDTIPKPVRMDFEATFGMPASRPVAYAIPIPDVHRAISITEPGTAQAWLNQMRDNLQQALDSLETYDCTQCNDSGALCSACNPSNCPVNPNAPCQCPDCTLCNDSGEWCDNCNPEPPSQPSMPAWLRALISFASGALGVFALVLGWVWVR